MLVSSFIYQQHLNEGRRLQLSFLARMDCALDLHLICSNVELRCNLHCTFNKN